VLKYAARLAIIESGLEPEFAFSEVQEAYFLMSNLRQLSKSQYWFYRFQRATLKYKHREDDPESVPVQGRTVPSKKPSTYVFDSNGDTHLTLTTYKAQTFHWEEETVWLGLEGSKKKNLKEKKKGKKVAAAPLPPLEALPESPVPVQMSRRATTDLSLAESDDIRDEGKGELMCTEPGTTTTSPNLQVQHSDYGERAGDLPNQVEIRMLVSGRHLALASSCFKKMFSGLFTEGKVDQSGLRRVTATDWDLEAFTMNNKELPPILCF
jgi:hypothetical protein